MLSLPKINPNDNTLDIVSIYPDYLFAIKFDDKDHNEYGTASPTMLRLYAIRVSANCYVVVHGGIKLTKQIQDTPQLKKELFSKIDNVLRFFKANGIIDTEDLKD